MNCKVKRYDPINSDGTCGMCVEDADYGAYVEFADYAALEAENAKLRAEVERLKAQLAEEIQRRFDGNEISSNEHREEVQRLQAQLAQQQRVPDGWKLVPVEPTPEMVIAAEEAHMPFGDMDIALRMAMLAAPAPVQAEPATYNKLRALISTDNSSTDLDSLTVTAETALEAVIEYGPKVIPTNDLDGIQIHGEQLATLLRATYSWRDEIPGWDHALSVAKLRLAEQGIDPDDALYGMT